VLQSAQQCSPEDLDSLGNLAVAYFRHGDYKNAIAVYEQLIGLVPDSPIYRFSMGNTYYQMRDYDRANQCLKEALRLSQEDVNIKLDLARVAEAAHRLDEAEELLHQILSAQTDHYQASLRLGNLFMKKHQYADAIEAYRKTLLIDQVSLDALNNIAGAYFEAGDVSQAAVNVREASPRIQPNSLLQNLAVRVRMIQKN